MSERGPDRRTSTPFARRRGLRRLALVLLAAAVPSASRGAARLLDEELRGPPASLGEAAAAPVDLSVGPRLAAKDAGASTRQQGASDQKANEPVTEPGSSAGSLDFDLLGAAPPAPPVDEGKLRLRRGMLTAHQAAGFGMLALEIATTVVGQLNYSDRFAGGPSTARYQEAHKILAYTTAAVFAATASLALFAPAPPRRGEGFDRVTLHRIAMFTAAAMMATQVVLGVATANREGYMNQETLATIHLAIGYATLAAIATGVGALVF